MTRALGYLKKIRRHLEPRWSVEHGPTFVAELECGHIIERREPVGRRARCYKCHPA